MFTESNVAHYFRLEAKTYIIIVVIIIDVKKNCLSKKIFFKLLQMTCSDAAECFAEAGGTQGHAQTEYEDPHRVAQGQNLIFRILAI